MSIILKVVCEYVELKKSGNNFIGLCPFHKETTPSFVVNPREESYHCYGCNEHGDAEKFYKEIEPEKVDMITFLMESDFNKIYGSQKDIFTKNEFAIMRVSFEAGWRVSRLTNGRT